MCSLPSRRNTQPAAKVSEQILPASSDDQRFLLCVGWQSAQGLFSPVFKNQGNRCPEVLQTFFLRYALTIGTRHLGAICDKPRIVSLNNRRELIAHALILP